MDRPTQDKSKDPPESTVVASHASSVLALSDTSGDEQSNEMLDGTLGVVTGSDISSSQESSRGVAKKKISRRRDSNTVLPPPRLVVPTQFDALFFYGTLSAGGKEGVQVNDVATRIGKSENTLSAYSNFFKNGIGALHSQEGKRGFFPAPEVLEYSNYRGKVTEQEERKKLLPLILRSWFGKVIIDTCKFRTRPSEIDLLNDLAQVAKVSLHDKDYQSQMRQLVEWAELTQLIEKEQDGKYRLIEAEKPEEPEPSKDAEIPVERSLSNEQGKGEGETHNNLPSSSDEILEALSNLFSARKMIKLDKQQQLALLEALDTIETWAQVFESGNFPKKGSAIQEDEAEE